MSIIQVLVGEIERLQFDKKGKVGVDSSGRGTGVPKAWDDFSRLTLSVHVSESSITELLLDSQIGDVLK